MDDGKAGADDTERAKSIEPTDDYISTDTADFRITYDVERDGYVAQCDWTTVTPSMAIVEMIAAITDRSPVDVSPLGRSVDPDAIDALLTRETRNPASPLELTLEHDGIRTTASADGSLFARRIQ